MSVDCCVCDQCFETFEQRASMSKTDKYAKGHRVRCPDCGSEATRPTAPGSGRLDGSTENGICQPLEGARGAATIREREGMHRLVNACATIDAFVPPMRCASGMCGPGLYEELVRFNQTLAWLEQRSGNAIAVHRYVLNQDRRKFVQNETVMSAMRTGGGWKVLPITMINGQIVKQGSYPSLAELTAALEGASIEEVQP